ncbi:MAG TPA: flavin reductase family protein [Streptosporangiaceae bacterium]|nr:flavin reductase family protein [Streptosporangiaceae bacterium]
MDHAETVRAVSAAEYRALMAGHPSGVAIVTSVGVDGQPVGLTCSSLCAVSLDPPLLLVCITNLSRTLGALQAAGMFAVNMIHRDGRLAAQAFAGEFDSRFASVRWSTTPLARLPYLPDDAHSVAECRVRSTVVAGDHTIVIGDVLTVDLRSPLPPLIYGRRRYVAWPQRRSRPRLRSLPRVPHRRYE